MIAYTATGGQELLLLAAKTSGKVVRLDPATRAKTDIATGLNSPESMVIDPVHGDLLVAEQDQVTTVAKSEVEAGLASASRLPGHRPRNQAAVLFPTSGTDGIAVDRCTGNIYLSNQTTGQILRFIRSSGELETVFSTLQQPTRLLAFYRAKVSCPDAFHLLAIEQGTNQILLTRPAADSVTPWIPAQGSTDIAFLRGGGPFSGDAAVLLTETVAEAGTVSTVETPDLYDEEPDNPPTELTCVGTVTLADANLAAVVREALGIDPGIDITCEQAQSLTELVVSDGEITELSGLEFFTNLMKLELDGNTISDITPVTGLTQLKRLFLGDNSISDITPVAGLTQLTSLQLSGNSISNITPLADLTQLTVLFLVGNSISDITPLVANAGLDTGDTITLGFNPLDSGDCADIQTITQLIFCNLTGEQVSPLCCNRPG